MINSTLINECIEYVARDFADAMHENGFDNFSEMSNCYWWNTSDIKEETRYIINEFNEKTPEHIPGFIFLGDDGTIYDGCNNEISYRKFIARVKKRADEMHAGRKY